MATTDIAAHVDALTVERVLLQGDLQRLTSAQKLAYYSRVCESLGLNPLTRPFDYIVLNGKEQLYAKREATEQLRKLHGVSLSIIAREVVEDCYIVTARATLPNGRTDESIGVKSIGTLKGEARANGMMTAETKAKRRVTLSICGLGLLDETEVSDIPQGAQVATFAPAAALARGGPRQTSAAALDAAPVDAAPDPAPARDVAPQGATDAPAVVETPATPAADVPGDDDLPPGYVRIVDVQQSPTRNANVMKFSITLSTGEVVSTINSWLANLAMGYRDERTPVRITLKVSSKYATDVESIKRQDEPDTTPTRLPMPTSDEIPF